MVGGLSAGWDSLKGAMTVADFPLSSLQGCYRMNGTAFALSGRAGLLWSARSFMEVSHGTQLIRPQVPP